MATEVMNAPEGRIIHKTYAVLSGAAIPQRVYVTQYDESLPVIACTLYKDGQLYTIPDGASVRLRMNKNGLPVYHEAMGIDDARHVVYLEITAQMTVLYGEFAMVLEVETSDGKTAGTSYLRLIVRQNPVQNPELDNIPDYTANSNRLTAEGVKKLQDESSTQQKAIEDKGKNTLESIPADYSALSGKVDKNTSGISELQEDLQKVDSQLSESITEISDKIGNPFVILKDDRYVPFVLPKNKKFTIRTKDGSTFKTATVKIYDSSKTALDYWIVSASYGNERIITNTYDGIVYVAKVEQTEQQDLIVEYVEDDSIFEKIKKINKKIFSSDIISRNESYFDCAIPNGAKVIVKTYGGEPFESADFKVYNSDHVALDYWHLY